MFVQCAPPVPSDDAVAEIRNPHCRSTSIGRFRLQQPRPLTPAEFTASLNAVNAYFDGALFLAPAWTVNPGSGGVLDCQVRNNKTVPGKNALRIALNFSMWGPKVPQLMVRALPLTALARRPSHEAVFESDDQILPWSEHDMILATARFSSYHKQDNK